ncbi:alpha/beta hydrolase [uncultured Pseudokineococcus sp.]|uniref:alpha/beta hydrolase n=1 Tax=uncultured Pseudokineococcus sp. TaxID=1642928 RepID=UPI00260D4D1C|nr:alpha/beta hydrolase [uncultured Pseudokineococcus sp.]
MVRFHPDLAVGRLIPPVRFGPVSTSLLNRVRPRGTSGGEDLLVEDHAVPGPDGAPAVRVRTYRPRSAQGRVPALLWIHGGGMVSGTALIDERANMDLARTLGVVVASVEYRLAPGAQAPSQVEDCYAALRWLAAGAGDVGVDPERIAVGGASAGGGLAAGLVLLAHDRGGPAVAFQLLVYPMIDDRTVVRDGAPVPGVRVWTPASNRYGWTSYLGVPPGSPGVSAYAAPARRADLTGLPPAWVGVGTLDLFHDEDVRYAHRLREAGVACALDVVEGAFHGFDALFPRRQVSRTFWRAQASALQTALFPDRPPLRWGPST